MTLKEKVLNHYGRRWKLAEKFLIAMKRVLNSYEGTKTFPSVCPLCLVVRYECLDCPWVIFIGEDSCDFMEEIAADEQRKKKRMAQLGRWINAHEEAIKEMKNEHRTI